MKDPNFKATINSADVYPLPFVGGGSSIAIQFKSAAFAGTGIVLKARSRGTFPNEGQGDWLPIAYTRLNVNGVASDNTDVTTPITDSGLIQVQVADGLEVALDTSAGGWSGGSIGYVATPVTRS